MLILGVDPGLRATGYGLVEGSMQGVRLIDAGVIRTSDDAPLSRRLNDIHERLSVIFSHHALTAVAVEDLYAAPRYPRTAILMGHVRGVVCQAAAARAIEVVALPPAAVKQAVAGFGAASKEQVQRAVRHLCALASPLDAHAADAVAMALVALSRNGVPLRAPAAIPAAAHGGAG